MKINPLFRDQVAEYIEEMMLWFGEDNEMRSALFFLEDTLDELCDSYPAADKSALLAQANRLRRRLYHIEHEPGQVAAAICELVPSMDEGKIREAVSSATRDWRDYLRSSSESMYKGVDFESILEFEAYETERDMEMIEIRGEASEISFILKLLDREIIADLLNDLRRSALNINR
jgi:hypothetical protein